MFSFLRENFALWLVVLGFLLLLDWAAIRAFKQRLSSSGLRGFTMEASQQTGRFQLERLLFHRKYARSADRAFIRIGDLALAVRLAYFAWFAFGLLLIFWRQ